MCWGRWACPAGRGSRPPALLRDGTEAEEAREAVCRVGAMFPSPARPLLALGPPHALTQARCMQRPPLQLRRLCRPLVPRPLGHLCAEGRRRWRVSGGSSFQARRPALHPHLSSGVRGPSGEAHNTRVLLLSLHTTRTIKLSCFTAHLCMLLRGPCPAGTGPPAPSPRSAWVGRKVLAPYLQAPEPFSPEG